MTAKKKKIIYKGKKTITVVLHRASKYKEEYCDKLVEAFSIEPYTLVETERMKEYWKDGRLKKELVRSKPLPNRIPTFESFAASIHVSTGTLVGWSVKHKNFTAAFTRAKELQKEFLMNLGLAGITPPAAFIFLASNMTDLKPTGVGDFAPGAAIIPVIINRGGPRIHEDPGKIAIAIPSYEESTEGEAETTDAAS